MTWSDVDALLKLLIFDLDGVLYAEDDVLPHTVETLKNIRQRGLKVGFLTNNSTKSRQTYLEKLTRMGFEAHADEIMTSNVIARRYLLGKAPNGARVYVIGEKGIYDELGDVFSFVDADSATEAKFVVVGWDRSFSFEKMCIALDALNAGAELVATNRDVTFPAPGGRILPGGGTMVAAIAAAWGREPYVCGKPNPLGIQLLMQAAGATAEETLIVGDRAETDILTGHRAGVKTCLVLTGITRPDQVASLSGELKPDHVINNLSELPPLLDTLARDGHQD